MSNPIPANRPVQLPFAALAQRLPAAHSATKLAPAKGEDNAHQDDIRKTAQSFEAIILRQLLGSMRKAKLSDDVFGSSATENFREMADARTADSIAEMRQFGIAEMVERQLRGIETVQTRGPME